MRYDPFSIRVRKEGHFTRQISSIMPHGAIKKIHYYGPEGVLSTEWVCVISAPSIFSLGTDIGELYSIFNPLMRLQKKSEHNRVLFEKMKIKFFDKYEGRFTFKTKIAPEAFEKMHPKMFQKVRDMSLPPALPLLLESDDIVVPTYW